MFNLIQIILGILVLILSVAWVINDDGYEPKIVFITAIAALLGAIAIKIKSRVNNSSDSEGNPQHASSESAVELIQMIKSYDYHLRKAKTIYLPLAVIVGMIIILWSISEINESIISGYDRFLSGDTLLESQKIYDYSRFKNREELVQERAEMLIIALIGGGFFLYIFIMPLILEGICKSFYKKTKYISERLDFKEISEEVNYNLKNYEFLNKEIVDILIKNFTRVTKECYMHNIIH